MAKRKSKPKLAPITCKYCKKVFKRESTILTHACEQKRRHLARNDLGVRVALDTYLRFNKFSQNSAIIKTYDEFAHSPYYSAFVRYGNYCLDTKVVSIPRYTDFLLRGSKPLDKWGTDPMYTSFLEKFVRTESIEDALTRSIEFSIEWGLEKSMDSYNLFRYGSINRILQALVTGNISPWILYQSESGQQFLHDLTPAQVLLIWDIIEPKAWQAKFENNKEDVEFAKSTLTLGGW